MITKNKPTPKMGGLESSYSPGDHVWIIDSSPSGSLVSGVVIGKNPRCTAEYEVQSDPDTFNTKPRVWVSHWANLRIVIPSDT